VAEELAAFGHSQFVLLFPAQHFSWYLPGGEQKARIGNKPRLIIIVLDVFTESSKILMSYWDESPTFRCICQPRRIQ